MVQVVEAVERGDNITLELRYVDETHHLFSLLKGVAELADSDCSNFKAKKSVLFKLTSTLTDRLNTLHESRSTGSSPSRCRA